MMIDYRDQYLFIKPVFQNQFLRTRGKRTFFFVQTQLVLYDFISKFSGKEQRCLICEGKFAGIFAWSLSPSLLG